jgi:hypothetical protein
LYKRNGERLKENSSISWKKINEGGEVNIPVLAIQRGKI